MWYHHWAMFLFSFPLSLLFSGLFCSNALSVGQVWCQSFVMGIYRVSQTKILGLVHYIDLIYVNYIYNSLTIRKKIFFSHPPIKLYISILPDFIPKLPLQRLHADHLPLRERTQRQRQRKHGRRQDQSQIHGQDKPRAGLQPSGALQPDEHQRRDNHNGRGVDYAAECRFADGDACGDLALS